MLIFWGFPCMSTVILRLFRESSFILRAFVLNVIAVIQQKSPPQGAKQIIEPRTYLAAGRKKPITN
jgi:hypothetical protein